MLDIDEKLMTTRMLALMKSNNYSYYDLESLTGYSRSTLQRYITKKPSSMSMKMLSQLSEIFNVSIDFLTGDSDDPINYDTVDVVVPKEMWKDEEPEVRIKKYLDFKNSEAIDTQKELGYQNTKQKKALSIIRRASENMTDQELDKMIKVLNVTFDGAFEDDGEDGL